MMSMSNKLRNVNNEQFRAVLRKDFAAFTEFSFNILNPTETFVSAPYLEAMAAKVNAVIGGSSKRLIFNLPPRYLKSFCCSVALPAWMLGRDPTLKIVCVSYSADLARKFANDTRALMKSARYKQVFPNTVISKTKDTEQEIETTRRGYRLATSVEGTLTGRGGDIMIIDDPIKTDDAVSQTAIDKANNWFRNTAVTRLNSKKDGRILIVMQRLHTDDLTGHLAADGDWDIASYPAIAQQDEVIETCGKTPWVRRIGDPLHPTREPLEILEQQCRRMGTASFSAQYLQQPIPIDGDMIKESWFKRYKTAPERENRDVVIQSWDTASKDGAQNDYSACVTALRRDRTYYILDVFRGRLKFPELKRAVTSLAQRFRPDYVFIEDAGSGIQVAQSLADGTDVRPIPIRPEGTKESRVYAQCGLIEAGFVMLPERAEWLDAFLMECRGFPGARHDDQVDALSQLLVEGERRRRDYDDINIGMPISIRDDRSWEEKVHSLPGQYPGRVSALGLGTFSE